MLNASPVPRRVRTPRWLDARLLLGVALVLGCVVLGSVVVSRASSSVQVWSAARDLAPGSVLEPDDLAPVAARLPGSLSSYVRSADSLVGRTVSRPLSQGELVPRAAVGATPAATGVTIPFDARSAPAFSRGQRISVWVSAKGCPQLALLRDVTVQDVTATGGGAFVTGEGQTVVVRVPSALADRVVGALALDGAVLRAGVLDGAPSSTANDALPSLAACTPA